MFSFLKSGFHRIKAALSKTRLLFANKLKELFRKPLNEETLEELERVLFEADLGSHCVLEFTDRIKKFSKRHPSATTDELFAEMKNYAKEILLTPTKRKEIDSTSSPHVILVVGVNGSGKTTSCAKLARLYQKEGKKVLLAAADTFRAAAIEQLELWAERLKVDIVKGQPGSDPSAVVFDAITAAKARGHDIVIADTAGRLQSKTELMQELAKVSRVCAKVISDSPHETLLVLDATTGQNALDQAKVFDSFAPLTGLVLTKLDGSAKGGILLSIRHQMQLPIKFIGVGESIEDLMPFDPDAYVDALFST